MSSIVARSIAKSVIQIPIRQRSCNYATIQSKFSPHPPLFQKKKIHQRERERMKKGEEGTTLRRGGIKNKKKEE